MEIPYVKYHALANDFLVIDANQVRLSKAKLGRLAITICHRRTGVGADGILYLSTWRGQRKVDVYNADGSWAEKSGNGLRISALHEFLKDRRRRKFEIMMDGQVHPAQILEGGDNCALISTQLGTPVFEIKRIPMTGKRRVMINAPLKVGSVQFPVTCLAVGNPHTVLAVDSFDFDWQSLGAEIEVHRSFPRGTNVEFVRVVSRRKIELVDWERGAGPTGSSGTGAVAAVCAMVMLGAVDRECGVYFDTGNLKVHWHRESDLIELTGPADYIAKGEFVFR